MAFNIKLDKIRFGGIEAVQWQGYIIAWKLCTTMKTSDVTDTLELALQASGCGQANVVHKPRLLSDNGSSYTSRPAQLYQRAISLTHFTDSQRAITLNQWDNQIRRVFMGKAIALRDDYDGSVLRRLAKMSKDAGQVRRFLSLAEIYDGSKRTKAARIGGVGLQIVRDWVLRFPGEAVLRHPRINERSRPGYSVRSAPSVALVRGSFYPVATPRPCNGISMKYRRKWPRAHTPFLSLTVLDGIPQTSSPSRTTSQSCRCRRGHQNSTPWKIYGSSCATTGFPAASSVHTMKSSPFAVTHGTCSLISLGK